MKLLAALWPAVLLGFQARQPDLNASGVPFTLGGKIVTSDGSPVPSRVGVFLVCGGVRVSVTYADSKGVFGFPQTTSAFSNCMVHPNHPGYRSEEVDAAPAIAAGRPNVGDVTITKGGGGVLTSATSADASKDARKAYDKGAAALKAAKQDEAAKAFEAAVSAYPKYADAWYQLGLARLQAKSVDLAREAFLKAVEIDPMLVGPQVQLGTLAGQKKNWAESAKYLDRALGLDPDNFPAAWYADAVAHSYLKELDAVERRAREASRRDPKRGNSRIDYLLALILADKGDYASAAAFLKSYLTVSLAAPDAEKVKQMISSLESSGK